MNWTHRRRISLAMTFLWVLLLAAGCGDDARLIDRQAGGGTNNNATDDENLGPVTPERAAEYIAQQEAVILPWTRQVDGPLVAQATVEEDRLLFPSAGNESTVGAYEVGDVLVSVDANKPFLRKITDIEQLGDTYVIHTRNAKLGEAVYKGELSSTQVSDAQGQPLDDGFETRRQYLQPEKENFGEGQANEEDPSADEDDNSPIQFSINPSVSVKPSFYFDLKIDPGSQNRSHNHFYSPHQRCPGGDESYCAPKVDGSHSSWHSFVTGSYSYESYCGTHNGEANVCQFRQEGFEASCDTMIAALDYAERNPGCKELFTRFYNGDLGPEAYDLDIWNNSACDHGGVGMFLPPHPVHIDWAKENCHGAVKRLVVDGQIEAEATTGRIGVEATQEWSSDEPYVIWQSQEKQLAQRVFFIGWLPVLITSNASLRLEAEYNATIKGSLTFDPIELKGLTFGGGFNKYASARYEDDKGVYIGGAFQRYSQGRYGAWQANPWRTPSPTLKGLTLQNPDAVLALNGTLSAKLSAIPRVDLLLYDVAGPFIEPLTPFGEVQLNAGGSISTLEGVQSGGGTCHDTPANVCARVGAQGNVGITAETICEDCVWSTSLYQPTCSDYCPANRQNLCAKWCMAGEQAKPVEVVLQWTSDELDFDLTMSSPDHVTYQHTTPTEQGWLHSGDTCPEAMGGTCVDSPNGIYYQERIFLEHSARAPDNSTLYQLEVKTFDAQASGGSFDVIVYKGGQRAKTFEGEAAPAKGESKTFEFTLR